MPDRCFNGAMAVTASADGSVDFRPALHVGVIGSEKEIHRAENRYDGICLWFAVRPFIGHRLLARLVIMFGRTVKTGKNPPLISFDSYLLSLRKATRLLDSIYCIRYFII